jgi:hypothetical protein
MFFRYTASHLDAENSKAKLVCVKVRALMTTGVDGYLLVSVK